VGHMLKAYETLGLSEGANLAQVRRAYRNLVRRWHPDRFTQDPVRQITALEMLKGINEAYEMVLAEISDRQNKSECHVWGHKAPTAVYSPSPVKAADESHTYSEPPAYFSPDLLIRIILGLFSSWKNLLFAAFVVAVIFTGIVMIDYISYRNELKKAVLYDSSHSSDADVGARTYGGVLPGSPSGEALSGSASKSPFGPSSPSAPYVQAPSAPIVPEAPAAPAAPLASPAR